MLYLRKSEERGGNVIDWLNAKHSFSFGHYYDPDFTGFGHMVVLNEDVVAPSGGFAPHGHKNMEIFTYVISGALSHKDSMGNEESIRAGEVQRMSAGTGVRHSEYNASSTEACHLFQIWFVPQNEGDTPSYEQKVFSRDEKKNQLKLLVSPSARESSLEIHQDVEIYASILTQGKELGHTTNGRKLWIQLASGALNVNGIKMQAGDGLAIEDIDYLKIISEAGESEFVLISMGSF